MPFKSEAQRRFMFARHPELAKKWAHKYGTPSDLPEHVRKTKAVKAALKKAMSK
jgi:hypothetical protein